MKSMKSSPRKKTAASPRSRRAVSPKSEASARISRSKPAARIELIEVSAAAAPPVRQAAAPKPKAPARPSRRKPVTKAAAAGAPAIGTPPPPRPAVAKPIAAPRIARRKTVAAGKSTGAPAVVAAPLRPITAAGPKPRARIARGKTSPKVEPAETPAIVPPLPQRSVSTAAAAPAPVVRAEAVVKPQTAPAPVIVTPPRRLAEPEVRTPPAATPPRPARTELPQIPAILLEDDKPAAIPVSGPGQRYSLGPTPPSERLEPEGELPDTYGTQELLLTARDPHWLYAHWDLTRQQQRYFNSLSVDRHLILRVCPEAPGAGPLAEVHVHPESRHWFIHVDRAGTRYVCELGFYTKEGEWVTISTSGSTLTPPDTMSEETSAEFVTIPYELPLAKLVALVKEAMQGSVPLARALMELRAQGHPGLPATPTPPPPAQWTPAQERALAEVISMDRVRRVWMGSLEITELIRRQFVQELASMAAAQFGAPTSPAGGAISSPMGGGQPSRGFWFNINAELIVYGATEPTATVTIGGRTIQLRPDGSFSYRFALPDGRYELPVVAVSADQTDGRAAELQFSRGTEYRGNVGTHPQDPGLKSPGPEHV